MTEAPVPATTPRRVALVHDWLTGMRGGERALEAICELFPDATRFALLHVPGSVSGTIESRPIRTSFIQWLPQSHRYYRLLLPLFPVAVEQFDLDDFDLIISTSHCAAKSVVPPGRTPHLCYCFTPMRYAWDQFDAYFGPDRVGAGVTRLFRWGLSAMARWDVATAGRVSRYVAISQYVAGRIRRYYNRDASVVYPPVDTAFFRPSGEPPGGYFLIVSAPGAIQARRSGDSRLRAGRSPASHRGEWDGAGSVARCSRAKRRVPRGPIRRAGSRGVSGCRRRPAAGDRGLRNRPGRSTGVRAPGHRAGTGGCL